MEPCYIQYRNHNSTLNHNYYDSQLFSPHLILSTHVVLTLPKLNIMCEAS